MSYVTMHSLYQSLPCIPYISRYHVYFISIVTMHTLYQSFVALLSLFKPKQVKYFQLTKYLDMSEF